MGTVQEVQDGEDSVTVVIIFFFWLFEKSVLFTSMMITLDMILNLLLIQFASWGYPEIWGGG